MRKKQANATTIRLEQADRAAIATIRELYGCPSDSAAIKLALRMVARGEIPPTPGPNEERHLHPHAWNTGLSVAEVGKYLEISTPSLSTTFIRDLYARMLLTRIVDDYACQLYGYGQERNGLVATCRGHEAVQVGSAICIEVGKDFTLPYYRDLGVVLTIGMTPYEVFRTYMQVPQVHAERTGEDDGKSHNEYAHLKSLQPVMHWGYHKHNLVTGSVPVATQVLHAAGIAFAAKLRKASVVTVAYCGDGADSEPDFLEGITFAAQHQLPVVFVYEQDDSTTSRQTLPTGLEHHHIDGTDIIAVYAAMRAAMQHAREGQGPVLLEMNVHRSAPDALYLDVESQDDPLLRCQRYLEEQGMWDEEWAEQLHERLKNEVEQAMQDALRDVS